MQNNVVRNISIGSLMMPLLTRGTSHIHMSIVAVDSCLLTSFLSM